MSGRPIVVIAHYSLGLSIVLSIASTYAGMAEVIRPAAITGGVAVMLAAFSVMVFAFEVDRVHRAKDGRTIADSQKG